MPTKILENDDYRDLPDSTSTATSEEAGQTMPTKILENDDYRDLPDSTNVPTQEETSHLLNARRSDLSRKESVFAAVTAWITLLILASIIIIIFGMHFIAVSEKDALNWHYWLIPISLMTPATILGIALIRAMYPTKETPSNDLPIVEASKEIAKAIVELIKINK